MADAFLDDESSRQSNRPIEYYDIALSTGVTYRIASGNRSLVVGSLLYTAEPSLRTEQIVPTVGDSGNAQMTLSLRGDHPVVRRWLQMGSPPRQTLVTAWRKQERSQLSEKIWTALAASLAVDGNVAKFLLPARTVSATQRTLPTITVSRVCGHVLYDSMCQAIRDNTVVSTTALYVDGRDVRLDLGDLAKVGMTTPWAEGGELVHVATGERMTIAAQADVDPAFSSVTTLSMQMPIAELRTGDAVLVYAGCAHDIVTCHVKFNNQLNYGGLPQLVTKNPFKPTGLGVFEEA